jgi:Transposase IS66 family
VAKAGARRPNRGGASAAGRRVVPSPSSIAGKRRHLHAACTESPTFLGLAPRSRAGAGSFGILPHFRGVVVHDAYFQLYDGYPAARHQLCAAHAVRELTAQDELYPHQQWAHQIRRVLSQLIKKAGQARAALRQAMQGTPWMPPTALTD